MPRLETPRLEMLRFQMAVKVTIASGLKVAQLQIVT